MTATHPLSTVLVLFFFVFYILRIGGSSEARAAFITSNVSVAKRQTIFSLAHNVDDGDDNKTPSFTLKQRNPYDVHVYYYNSSEREKAMLLREKMKQKFPWMRFYTPKDKPIGPHPLPMWEADFASYDNRIFWSEVCDFIKAEHDGLSVLIHPHSMDGDYADHTKNAFWVGDVLELRIQEWKR